MNPFDYLQPTDVDEALRGVGNDVVPFAGGTDLLTRFKLGLDEPDTLVDIKASGLARDIDAHDDRLEIGALATLTEIAADAEVSASASALQLAASSAATTQIRNRATIGGNLLQSPRCSYYRDPSVECWRKGGEGCPAVEGRNQHHAIFGDGPCHAVHPSDLATALVALGASVRIESSGSDRQVDVAALLRPPTEERRVEHRVESHELIAELTIPVVAGRRSTYVKEMDRATWAFALVGVAAVVDVDAAGTITHASVVAGGVANVPHRLDSVSDALVGCTADTLGDVGDLGDVDIASATTNASPLRENGYKVPLLEGAVAKAIRRLV